MELGSDIISQTTGNNEANGMEMTAETSEKADPSFILEGDHEV